MTKPDFPHWIDSTTRKDFDTCPTKAYYGAVRNIQPIGSNVHLHFGKCLASGLETFRRAFFGDSLSLEDAKTQAVEKIITEWAEFEEPEGTVKTLENCILALDSYLEQYPPHDDPARPARIGDRLGVEFTFAIPIPNIKHPQTGKPILYTGRFDMIADYQGALFVEDDKTASQLGKSWQNNFRLASQLSGYCWACKQYGIPVQGAIVRGIGIYKTYFAHQMLILTRSQWMIDRWLYQLQKDIRRMIVMWENDDWDMSLDSGCSAYGGCGFLPLCESRDPERYIDSYYQPRNWNPLA